ncbi:mucin-5AC-like [Diprion similis]|uniref:mucin-5AC-like n=1 Tax=Diprion similis TaxID=362088 RepID=UPI001EF95410|nr:mucin-5AC-like [Diprion similis]
MATDSGEGDYLGAYRRFFEHFVAQVDPEDQLPVKVSSYDLTEAEISGEIIDWTLQYLNQKYCPPSLQSYLVHLVLDEVKRMCSKQSEACEWRFQDNTFAPLRLMQVVIGKVNEICLRYLENSRLALLPPPPSTPIPLVSRCAIKNSRRKMEDRHVVIHDLHTIFSIKDDSAGHYYAVFDGHAGQDAAVYCAAHLHQYLAESIHYPTDPERALRDAFLTTDAHFIEKSNKQNLNSGTTAVCALLAKRKLYIAWVGDSQAVLAKRGQITQLVNPHKPDRDDERERVNDMGGAVIHWGIWRVNGQLAVSRAIGDVQYKPYVTGDPDVRCIPLDGTEDFLIVACDGLWDFVSEAMATTLVYQQLREDPRDLEVVSQRLVYFARSQGSTDNISTIVVFLTDPCQIAARHPSSHPLLADVQLNNMESTNPFLSNANGLQFDENPFGKQHQQQTNGTCGATDNDDNHRYDGHFDPTSNGKHPNGATQYESNAASPSRNNDQDDDDEDDLGPETDVDAVDEGLVPVPSNENISRELFPEEKHRDDQELFESKSETVVSHLPAEPDQHAVIPEADNVADSEDSEDEWNYYPNKEKEQTTPEEVDEHKNDKATTSVKPTNEAVDCQNENQLSEAGGFGKEDLLDNHKEINKTEQIDSDICAKQKLQVEFATSEAGQEDMDFQLNPNAAEFVPVSPPKALSTRTGLNDDFLLSGSPQKQTPEMDDISVPSQGEFQIEVSLRPHETEHSNGESTKDLLQSEFTDYLMDRQKSGNVTCLGLDESEISSTKAEFGDESTTSFITATDFQRTGISVTDDSFGGSEREDYDISKDPMAMSFTPGDFQAAFEKDCDLNVVHQLNDSDLIGDGDEENIGAVNNEGLTAQSPELHPELTTLVTPGSDHPPPTAAFPDSRDEPMVDFLGETVEKNENLTGTNISNPGSPEPLIANETSLMSGMVELIPPFSTASGNLVSTASPQNYSGDTGYHAVDSFSKLDSGTTPEPAPHVFCTTLDEAKAFGTSTQIDIETNISPVPKILTSALAGMETTSYQEISTSPKPAVSSSPNLASLAAEDDTTLSSQDKVIEISKCFSFTETENKEFRLSPPPTSEPPVEKGDACDSRKEELDSVLNSDVRKLSTSSEDIPITPPVAQDESCLNEEVNTSPDEHFKLVLDETSTHESPNTDIEKQKILEEYQSEIPEKEVLHESPSLNKSANDLAQGTLLLNSTHQPLGNDNIAPEVLVAEPITREEIAPALSSEVAVSEDKAFELRDEAWQENNISTEVELHKEIVLDKEAIAPEKEVSEGVPETLENLINKEPKIDTPVMNLSESMQEFTGLEQQLNPELHPVPSSNGMIVEPELKTESQSLALEPVENLVEKRTEVKYNDSRELEESEKVEKIGEVEKSDKAEPKTDELSPCATLSPTVASVAAAAAAVATTVTASAATKTAKVKPTTKTGSKTPAPAKITNKSTPTSPTKSVGAAQRVVGASAPKRSVTGSTTSRPKHLETAKTSVTGTINKSPAVKAPAKVAPLTKTSTARTSVSLTAAPRSKPTSTISKPTPITSDKKSTANGDVRTSSKSAPSKPATRSSTGLSTTVSKTTTKTSATARSTSTTSTTTTSRPKSVPATTTTARPKPTSTSVSSPRPKTATTTGVTGLVAKPKSAVPKSPAADKLAKETTNKQLSSARTNASTLTKTGRSSVTGTSTTSITAKRNLTSKNTPPATTQPQKKPAPITRPGGKLSAVKNSTTKTTITTTIEAEHVQNGITEVQEQKTMISTSTIEEDVPQKDASLVTSSTDNQLIMTAD